MAAIGFCLVGIILILFAGVIGDMQRTLHRLEKRLDEACGNRQ